MKRVAITGPSGSGKSTLARHVSESRGIPWIELDALNHQPNWVPAEPDELRAQVDLATDAERWACDGNYRKVQDIVWGKADTIVLLAYPLPLVWGRLLKRTIRRSWYKEELWNGNREDFIMSFFSRESVLFWLMRTYKKTIRSTETAMQDPRWADKQRLIFRSPKETEAWLRSLR